MKEEKTKPRLPVVGDYIRTVGKLIRIDDVTPPPTPVNLEFVFESTTARVEAFANGYRIHTFETFNDFYGVGTCLDNALDAAKKRSLIYGPAIEFRVIKIVSQFRRTAHREGKGHFYDREFVEMSHMNCGSCRDLPDDVETVVWSSLDPENK